MATIRKRGTKWQAQVRRKGCPPLSRSFIQKADAQAWARQMEIQADREDLPVRTTVLNETTLGTLIRRYLEEARPSILA